MKDDFKSIYLDFYPSLVLFARKILKGREEWAEDLVQDVFIRTWETNRKIRMEENLATYFYQAVRFRCLNELRNQKRRQQIEDKMDLPTEKNVEMLYCEQEVVRQVNKAISQLPPKCREIFLKHIDGLSQREIAEQMGISEETVKKQKQIARKMLKEKIGDALLFFFVLGRACR